MPTGDTPDDDLPRDLAAELDGTPRAEDADESGGFDDAEDAAFADDDTSGADDLDDPAGVPPRPARRAGRGVIDAPEGTDFADTDRRLGDGWPLPDANRSEDQSREAAMRWRDLVELAEAAADESDDEA